jgi:hypothetical protein
MDNLYDTDFYSWSLRQADLVRQGRFNELDLDNLIEEIEDMGKSQYRTLTSSLGQLLMHLLKWQMQSRKNDLHTMDNWRTSWQVSIGKQRPDIRQVLEQNPGLKPRLNDSFTQAYRWATERAAVEMHCKASEFPETCPWTFEQVMKEGFLP